MNQEQRNDLRRLASAIRVGSQDTRQAVGYYFGWWQESGGWACALGAAALGLGADLAAVAGGQGRIAGAVRNHVYEQVPGADQWLDCPSCKNHSAPTTSIIEHLNDNHRWAREAIADWLDTLADQDEQSQVLIDEFMEAAIGPTSEVLSLSA